MVSEPSSPPDDERADVGTTARDSPSTHRSAGTSTGINAILGGLVGIVLAFLPFSTVLGGGVAGYLEGGDPKAGLRVGTLAGLIMVVPFVLIMFFALFLLGFAGIPRAIGIVGVLALVFVAVYTIGLGALGGYLGGYVKNEL
jgi:hypothetical protein